MPPSRVELPFWANTVTFIVFTDNGIEWKGKAKLF
jgi:hypothetical protein